LPNKKRKKEKKRRRKRSIKQAVHSAVFSHFAPKSATTGTMAFGHAMYNVR
jgi:hypothetical protein